MVKRRKSAWRSSEIVATLESSKVITMPGNRIKAGPKEFSYAPPKCGIIGGIW